MKNDFFDISQNIYELLVSGELSRNEFALAMVIVFQWNAMRRPLEFNLRTKTLISILGFSKSNFFRYRNVLKQKGVIDFKMNKGSKSSTYTFVVSNRTTNTIANRSTNTIANRSTAPSQSQTDKGIKPSPNVMNVMNERNTSLREIPKEVKSTKKYDPDENVPTEVYKQIEDRFGKPAIGIFKKNKVPLYFVKWIVEERKISLRKVRNPVFYICSLAKDPDLFGDFNAWLAQEYKKGWDVEIPWMQSEA